MVGQIPKVEQHQNLSYSSFLVRFIGSYHESIRFLNDDAFSAKLQSSSVSVSVNEVLNLAIAIF